MIRKYLAHGVSLENFPIGATNLQPYASTYIPTNHTTNNDTVSNVINGSAKLQIPPTRFMVSQKLYGREDATTTLIQNFNEISTGAIEVLLLLVHGYSGVTINQIIKINQIIIIINHFFKNIFFVIIIIIIIINRFKKGG